MNEYLLPLLNKAYFFLKFRPRTEKEIRDYLCKKIIKTHWSRDDVEKVIEKLKEQGLIDDEKFVEMYIKNRLLLKPKGKNLLKKELILKGINNDLIEKYFSLNQIDEENVAFAILKKRWSRFKNLDFKRKLEKSLRFLVSKGFSYETAKKTFELLSKKE
ncbi:MAG: RecX family transcriptional regulator [Patescibacteria group bacterium]|nr:RecX family transcriptional regulator [Patescibacteria group bacterium]